MDAVQLHVKTMEGRKLIRTSPRGLQAEAVGVENAEESILGVMTRF